MAKRVPSDLAGTPPKRRGPRQNTTNGLLTDDLQVLFGKNLRAARIARGMTLNEAGGAAGMKNQAVSQIEHGRKNLTLATMRKLAAVVGLNVSDMIRLHATEAEPASQTPKNDILPLQRKKPLP